MPMERAYYKKTQAKKTSVRLVALHPHAHALPACLHLHAPKMVSLGTRYDQALVFSARTSPPAR